MDEDLLNAMSKLAGGDHSAIVPLMDRLLELGHDDIAARVRSSFNSTAVFVGTPSVVFQTAAVECAHLFFSDIELLKMHGGQLAESVTGRRRKIAMAFPQFASPRSNDDVEFAAEMNFGGFLNRLREQGGPFDREDFMGLRSLMSAVGFDVRYMLIEQRAWNEIEKWTHRELGGFVEPLFEPKTITIFGFRVELGDTFAIG